MSQSTQTDDESTPTEPAPDVFTDRDHPRQSEFREFTEAIRNSYWLEDEFNLAGDVQDYRVGTDPTERSVIRKTMLAIAQIEVKVKSFWGDIGKTLPDEEIAATGATFAESEVRHRDAYKKLLEELGLQDAFKTLEEVPAIQQRLDYLDDCLDGADSDDRREYTQTILLFSTFVEHVSLFSQFLIMSSFDKERKDFSGLANVVAATSKEEQIHGQFGLTLVDVITDENPELFGDEFDAEVREACQRAFEAELEILDWIFADGDLEFLPKEQVVAFLKNRFNTSLTNVGVEPLFDPDEDLLAQTEWFRDDIRTTADVDFFASTSVNYNKQKITTDDLF